MKANTRHRQLKVLCGRRSLGSFYRTLDLRLTHLASAFQMIRAECWEQRDRATQPWDDFVGTDCIGCVDTMPVYVRRPKEQPWLRALFQGKYKAPVVKVQLVNNCEGLPLYWSGPHAGVRADIRIWRENGPALTADQTVLGDKAYVGCETVIAPYKRAPGRQLSREKKDYNTVHS